ncbi:hypothetical protein [Fictibacillus sp. KU28468]|uniref:hypothetical protein n=1 Tax=Fictibacillus sp. KU28468 TaxID=2991053 RepID=UPI00223D5DB2|nr:hypothetical protein [Fictibacillus sp. KU28468]UZJ79206.1 hypothetical protein OKX00_01580 [Fictibacillus sp. KU28468]
MISAPGCSLSAGRAVSLLAQAPAGVSPVTLVPQESRTLHSNLLFIEDFSRQRSCLKVNFRLSGQPLFIWEIPWILKICQNWEHD